MVPAILKVGTWGTGGYFLRGNKPLITYQVGDKIFFKPQLVHGAEWEGGRVTENNTNIGMMRVERF